METDGNNQNSMLASLVEMIPGMLFQCRDDAESSLLYVSHGCFGLTGYVREDFLGGSVRGLASLMAEEDRVSVYGECAIHRGAEGAHAHEYRLLRKDGARIWVLASCQRRFASDGSVLWLEGFIQDITSRKEAELGSTEREAQLQALAECFPDPVFVVDPSDNKVPFRILYVTPAVERTHGYRPDEVIGKSLTELLDGAETAIAAPERARRLMAGEQMGFEVTHLHRDGHLIPMEVRAGRIPWGGQMAIFGINRDLTSLRVAEVAAMVSEDRWKLAIECAGGALWEWLPQSQTLRVSDRWKAMLGYAENEIGTSIDEWISRIHPDDLARALAAFDDHIAGKTPTYVCDHRLRHKDGSWFWVSGCGRIVEWDKAGNAKRVIGMKTDITPYKTAQDQVRHLSDRLALALRGAGYGVWEYDLANGKLIWDETMFSVYGLDPSQFTGDLECWQRCIHPEDLPSVMAKFQDVLAGDRVTEFLFRIRRGNDQSERIIEANGFLQREENNRPQRLVGMNRDVTEQRLAAKALGESEHRFRSFVENANDVILSIQPDGRFSYVSPNWARMMGEPAKAAIGRLASEYVHPDDEAMLREFMRDVRAGTAESNAMQYRVRFADGTWRWHMTTVSVLRGPDGEILSFLCIGRDITQAKLAESERERHLTAIEQSGEVIMIFDAQGAIQYVNPAFTKATGYESSEVVGAPLSLMMPTPEDPTLGELMRTVSKGQNWSGRLTNKRKDGAHLIFDVIVSPVRDRDEKVLTFVAVKRDITEYLRLQSQVMQAEKMQVVGRLAGGVAHDFNNMLTLILAHADLAMESLPAGTPAHSDLGKIRDAAERSGNFTRQLLAFARQQHVTPQVLNLNARISGMLNIFDRVVGQNIRFQWHPGEGVWPVLMDPAQMDQIISNLIVNARDAIEGEGIIAISAENYLAQGQRSGPGAEPLTRDFVVMHVSDTGVGMAPETLTHIFEPFFTTKEPSRGTGLGLATVYGSVTQSGGCIDVRSAPGEGTVFSVYLPRAKGEGESKGLIASKSMGRGQETILFVEDEPSILDFGKRVLAASGYRVLAASSPEEALRISNEYSSTIDMLLTDVMMPVMSGRQLSQILQKLRPGLRVLYISGYTAQEFGPEVLEDPNFHFLQKPFGVDVLREKVREVLNQRR